VKKYGCINVSQNNEIMKKIKKTTLKNFGTECILTNNLSREAGIKSNRLRCNKKMQNKHNDIISADYDKNIYFMKCELCGQYSEIETGLFKNRKNTNSVVCTLCNPPNSSKSGQEDNVYQFILSKYDGEILRNKRKYLDNEYELDFYFPEFNLGIEFNGIWWHNEINKPNDYHKKKYEICKKKNIKLIQIWESDWIYKTEIVKNLIMKSLDRNMKIDADLCMIKVLCGDESIKKFLIENDINGFIHSSKKVALYYNGEIVYLMCLNKNNMILRNTTKIGYNIINAEKKIIKYLGLNNYYIIIDRMTDDKKIFQNIGFILEKNIQPKYFYVVGSKLVDSINYRKSILIKEGFNTNKTEHEIMLERGIYRIYDAGHDKLSLKL